jgi:hypothetical protein
MPVRAVPEHRAALEHGQDLVQDPHLAPRAPVALARHAPERVEHPRPVKRRARNARLRVAAVGVRSIRRRRKAR